VNPKFASPLVRDLGEQGLLKRVQRYCPAGVVGDDAAVLETLPGRSLVVTTDVLVDQVHFSDRTTSPEDAGWRAAAANLSDLAAMGAKPLGITVGLGLPGDLSASWVERLYQGMTACLQQYETTIVGGDICRSPVVTLAITAFGQVSPSQIIRRSAAQVGDAILITGFHGLSRGGLELLLQPQLSQSLSDLDREVLVQAHQRPKPRLDVLPLLEEILYCPSRNPNLRVAGMDSSDGLADAVVQICQSSQVGARIHRSGIPILPALSRFVSPEQALNWALYGGEDFELVLCLSMEKAQPLVERLGEGAAIIGTITTDRDVWLVDTTGVYADESLTLKGGFQHFGS